MEAYQREFIRFIAARGALKFGSFRTKSGRQSPYFFNAGELSGGADLLALGAAYAGAVRAAFGSGVDILYGPAYKGITLAAAAAMELSRAGVQVSCCFNRKEAKDHGESGLLIGRAPKAGDRVVLVDDVITAGTSVRESLDILGRIQGVKLLGMVVALDRQEHGAVPGKSALAEVEEQTGLALKPIVRLEHVLEMARAGDIPGVGQEQVAAIEAYREQYGA